MSNFSWIMSAVVVQYVLAFIRPLSLILQSESCDVMRAYEEAQILIAALEKQQSEEVFHQLFNRACTTGTDTFGDSFTPDKPRTCKSSRDRPNAGDVHQTVEQNFRCNCFYPFLDAALSCLRQRFPEELRGALLGSQLIPNRLGQLDDDDICNIKTEFATDLPQPDSLEQEVGFLFNPSHCLRRETILPCSYVVDPSILPVKSCGQTKWVDGIAWCCHHHHHHHKGVTKGLVVQKLLGLKYAYCIV